jgi:hypothetical protein
MMHAEMTHITMQIITIESCLHGNSEVNVEETSTGNKVQNAK